MLSTASEKYAAFSFAYTDIRTEYAISRPSYI